MKFFQPSVAPLDYWPAYTYFPFSHDCLPVRRAYLHAVLVLVLGAAIIAGTCHSTVLRVIGKRYVRSSCLLYYQCERMTLQFLWSCEETVRISYRNTVGSNGIRAMMIFFECVIIILIHSLSSVNFVPNSF